MMPDGSSGIRQRFVDITRLRVLVYMFLDQSDSLLWIVLPHVFLELGMYVNSVTGPLHGLYGSYCLHMRLG